MVTRNTPNRKLTLKDKPLVDPEDHSVIKIGAARLAYALGISSPHAKVNSGPAKNKKGLPFWNKSGSAAAYSAQNKTTH